MRNQRVAKYRGGYAVVWYDETGKRHRYSLGKVSRSEAYAAANRVVARALAAKDVEARTVGQIVETYLAESDAIGVEILQFHWKAARATFQHLLPQHVTEAVCRRYARERKVKPGTIRKELGVVRAALLRAKAGGAFWMPQPPPPRDRRLTREEMTALEAQCTQTHLLVFLLLARYTAARASAILSLKWAQVDFERRRIDLGGLGRQKRRAVVPMHPNLAFALAIANDAALSPFVVEYGGRRCASIKKGFAAACKRAGIEGVTPHVLRHTAASWMAEAGVSMDEIAQFLGHTNPSVTYRVYARFSPAFLQRAADALG